MSDFCECGRVVVGRCQSCKRTVCAEHAWNGPKPPSPPPLMRFERDAGGSYLVPGPVAAPGLPLPAGAWRPEQEQAMQAKSHELAAAGLLCWVCVEPTLVAAGKAAQPPPPPPVPPTDPLEALAHYATRRALAWSTSTPMTDEESRAGGLVHLKVSELVLSDPGFRARFGQALHERVAGPLHECECGRGHRFFFYTPIQVGDSGKSSAYQQPEAVPLDAPGVRNRWSVDSEGLFWKCMQHVAHPKGKWFSSGTSAYVEWQCIPLEVNEGVLLRAMPLVDAPLVRTP